MEATTAAFTHGEPWLDALRAYLRANREHAVEEIDAMRGLGALVTSYMRDAATAGSYNVGGPYALSGSAFFTDDTHHDHVHAGFAS